MVIPSEAYTTLGKQLKAMDLTQLADVSKWTANPELRHLAITTLSKQLKTMDLTQLADVSKWTANPELRHLAITTLSKQLKTMEPTVEGALRRLTRSVSQADKLQLVENATKFSSLDVAGILRNQADALLENPAEWLRNTEEAAAQGDDLAKDALLLVKYLLDCFALLARRLDPSAKTIELFGSLASVTVLVIVVFGTIGANNPKALEKVNDYLSSPLGILGVVLGVTALIAPSRPCKHKASKPHRGVSKPRRKMLRRRTFRR